jgi:hypothetical protein
MKRAAILIIAIATLVLVGYPSTPSLADSSSSLSIDQSRAHAGVSTTGGTLAGEGVTGGGANEGDADGLSGFKNRPPVMDQSTAGGGITRVMVMLESFWKFMLWTR